MKPQSPCYKCDDRYYNCHSYCEKYLNFQEEWKQYKKQRRDEQQKYIQAVGYEAEKRKRLSRYKK